MGPSGKERAGQRRFCPPPAAKRRAGRAVRLKPARTPPAAGFSSPPFRLTADHRIFPVIGFFCSFAAVFPAAGRFSLSLPSVGLQFFLQFLQRALLDPRYIPPKLM